MAKGSIPVLVGVGQSVSHWDGKSGAEGAPSPNSLAVEASQKALSDAGVQASAVDVLAVARLTSESTRRPRHPLGQNSNTPGTIARDLGAVPKKAIYAVAGGQSSQQLVNEMASLIHAGEAECVLVTGSEANKTSKAATKLGLALDWTDDDPLEFEDRGPGPMMLNRPEIKHGMVLPAYFYAMFENAMAQQAGETRAAHRKTMATLWAKFAAVARTNPNAQFKQDFDAEFLATPSRENYPFADPFLKWHMAQDAVNLGAATLLMSEEKADELGVPAGKRVYLHGAGEASDVNLSERISLTSSWAMENAIGRALKQAGKTSADMHAFDLYSCFPCAVFSSMAVLGIDHTTDPRPLTVTGGLPFFGGPGNNYSLHAIASMAEHLRQNAGDYGLVLANGGWMSKEAVGIWSTERPSDFTPVEPAATPTQQVDLAETPTTGKLETFTVTYGKSGPEQGIIFARTETGERFIAIASPSALPRLLEDESPIGLAVTATTADEVNTFSFV